MQKQQAETVLHDVFGYKKFRGKQAEVIEHVMGGRNALVVMPTGAGKSLCFQVPAMMMSGMTIVISPLISLMQNQVAALKMLGIEAASINSNNTQEDNQAIWQKMQNGVLKLLYLSPEKLMTPRMLDAVSRLDVSLFAIDEAHCISQWGAAFRPEYEGLSELHKRFSETPIIALTATADTATRDQICEKIFSGNVKTYLTGFDRPNISLKVEIKNGWKQQLIRFLSEQKKTSGIEPENGIVYCLSRKSTEEAAALLVEKGYNALSYHAGMPNEQRAENLNRFMVEPDLIMVATIAFGMGIDKPDIRFVFHTDLPASPEAYYQEIGRAGRDGKPAIAHMLYGMDDIRRRRMFIDNEGSAEDHRRRGHQRLNALLAFCEAPECRRASLLTYFGDTLGVDKCGNCDLCDDPREMVEATDVGQKMLSAIYRTDQSYGVAHIADILTGKVTEKIERQGHDALSTFGIGKDYSANEWKSIARQLMARGFIVSDMEFGSLKITEQGVLLLKGKENFKYRPDAIAVKASRNKPVINKKMMTEIPEEAREAFQALKEFRRGIASERGVPAYIIFSDKSLLDMAIKQPKTISEFGDVYGVGTGKQKEFGDQFIAFIFEQQASM